MSERDNLLIDAKDGKSLLTMKAAAELAGMHPVSMKRLVAKGVIPRRGRVGRTVLVSRDDVISYRSGRSIFKSDEHLTALFTVRVPDSGVVRPFRVRRFSWDQLPYLKKKIAQRYGVASFEITVKSVDGGEFHLRYSPPAWVGN